MLDKLNELPNGIKRGLLMGAIALSCIIGGGLAVLLSPKNDSPLEEIAESILEDQIEMALSLPRDELSGKIDFTPKTPE